MPHIARAFPPTRPLARRIDRGISMVNIKDLWCKASKNENILAV